MENTDSKSTFSLTSGDLINVGRGMLMGGADIIPGVSGGTVALILGIYERLVSAISRFDLSLAQHARERRFREAAEHVDLQFLVTLGCGVVLGIASLASVMNYLLINRMQFTFAVFSGLILSSSFLVARMARPWNAISTGLMVIGAGFAWWLVGLPFLENPPTGLVYTFFCGMVGICAMILPGISGAFILLILGEYVSITGALKEILHLNLTPDNVKSVVVFCLGCLTGLIAFSKFLRWLLARYQSPTMALLCGFMVGSLRKLWPFKTDLTPDVEKFKLKVFENIMPETLDGRFWITAGLFAIAFASVFVLDRVARGQQPPVADESAPE